jgi:serine/threonine protein kinase
LNAAAAQSPKPPGASVGGYTLIAEVGRGGMGSVYKATAPDGSTVAVKLLASHLHDNPVLLKRFQQEARLAKRIIHPNLVKAIELGEHDGEHFFAMEFVEGESVGAKVKRERRFGEREAVRICIAVGEALAAAHEQGLIHRDVKPDNIMLTASGEVKLADMGLAKDTAGEDLNLTKTGRGLGTPHFMAPEQFKEAKSADSRCDVYSLGATLYMMVTGCLPFRANNPLDAFIKKSQNDYTPPEELVKGMSARLVRTIKHAMEADPKKRPQTMREFVSELKAALPPPKSTEVWYVIYKDAAGEKKKVKGTQPLVAAMIRNRKLNANATASKDKQTGFKLIRDIPEFAALFADDSTASFTPAQPSSQSGASTNHVSGGDATPISNVELSVDDPSPESSRFESLNAGESQGEDVDYFQTPAAPVPPVAALDRGDRGEVVPMTWFVVAIAVAAVLIVAAFFAGRMTA